MTGDAGHHGRTYLVTGASSGIGRASAQALAARGADLVLVSRSAEALGEVREECERLGAECLVMATDVGDTAQVDRAFVEAVQRFGRLDGVVHSAAVIAYGTLEQVPEEVFRSAVNTNLLGTAAVARRALSLFRQQGGGRLVVLGSLLGNTALPYLGSYVTTKWAVHGLVRSLQIETRGDPGIDVTLVTPRGVDTPIYRQAASYVGRHGKAIPPVQDPAQVAEIVVSALERPGREVPTGIINRLFTMTFRVMPGLFDVVMARVMPLLGFERGSHLPPTAGNVLRPHPRAESVTGPETDNTDQDLEGTTMASEQTRPSPPVSRDVAAPASAVWDVLADGWTYATWVVGTSRVRDVEPDWPAPGSRIHHAFGPWPAVVQDYTVVEESTPQQELVMKARGWPLGEARAMIRIEPQGDDACRISISEDAIAGPGKLMPHPVRQAVVLPRNRETLYRLALLAEGRHREKQLNAP